MLMATQTIPVNGNVTHISGRGIRRRKLSREQRIRLAADLVSRKAQLELSITQSAALLSVAPADVSNVHNAAEIEYAITSFAQKENGGLVVLPHAPSVSPRTSQANPRGSEQAGTHRGRAQDRCTVWRRSFHRSADQPPFRRKRRRRVKRKTGG